MQIKKGKLAIIAGEGDLVLSSIDSCKTQNINYFLIGIKEFYNDIGNYYIVQSGDTDKAENTIEKNILFKSTEDSSNLARYIVDHG